MKVSYACVDCGKMSTGRHSTSCFSQSRENYRCLKCAQKKCQSTPEARKKMSEILKRVKGASESRQCQSDAMKKYYGDPQARLKQSEIQKKSQGSPEARQKMSVVQKNRYKNPEVRKRHSDVHGSSETKKKCSKSMIIYYEKNPEIKKKQSDISKKLYLDRQWYGSVKYHDVPHYCEKWNENLRERVRAFFGYRCLECETPQNGKKLHVHHVWYNKGLCCDDTPRSLVPLCHSCHTKSNHNRSYWSNHFQEIIDTRCDGRCWLSREEYAAL